MSKQSLNQRFDHTALKPGTIVPQIIKLCQEAKKYRFPAVCVNPVHVKQASTLLKGSNVDVATVVGFPLGSSTTNVKVFETIDAIHNGAKEIDMVICIDAIKEGQWEHVQNDIASVAKACHARNAILKVILEMCLLTEEEKKKACQVCVAAGADYVKTSTGFSTSGASLADVRLMSSLVKTHGLKIKAAGGIRTVDAALQMVVAGADRIGASSSVSIMEKHFSSKLEKKTSTEISAKVIKPNKGSVIAVAKKTESLGSTRKPFIGGNWKSNGSRKSIQTLVRALNLISIPSDVDVCVCPTNLYIDYVYRSLKRNYLVGSQDCSSFPNGAHTGKVSAAQLYDFKIRWVVIGHSETRHKETPDFFAKKVELALKEGLSVIVCVGETSEQRKSHQVLPSIIAQLQPIADIHPDWSRIVIAYEHTGLFSSKQIQGVHANIRRWLREVYGTKVADTRIIYGGGVTSLNCHSLISMKDVDGFFVSEASLEPKDFEKILLATSKKIKANL